MINKIQVQIHKIVLHLNRKSYPLGKSPILISQHSFKAVDFTTVKLYWSIINDSIEKVKNFNIKLFEALKTSNVREFTTENTSLVVTDLKEKLEYSFSIQARDFNGSLSVFSTSINFILDGTEFTDYSFINLSVQ